MTPQEWPVGIDLVGRYWHWAMRTLARGDKLAIEKLAAESADVGCFDIAAAVYMAERPKTYPQHPGVRGLRRLLRLHVRHYRREIVAQRQYLEMAARQALMASMG